MTTQLTGQAAEAATIINKTIGKEAWSAYRTPEEWDGDYGRGSILIIIHEEDDTLARHCSYDRYDYLAIEKLSKALNHEGYWVEQCTTWYSAVYKG